METLNAVEIAVVLFATTNTDDIFVLLGFFSDKSFSASQVVVGQYLGIAVLVGVCILASLVSLVLKPEYIGLLGLLPIIIGLKKLYDLRRLPDDKDPPNPSDASNVLAVAGVTVANGATTSVSIRLYLPPAAPPPLSPSSRYLP